MPSGSPPENDGFAARLAVFYAASIMALGIGMPLFPLWLRARGLDAQAIGVVLTVPLVVRTLAIPLAARCGPPQCLAREPARRRARRDPRLYDRCVRRRSARHHRRCRAGGGFLHADPSVD